jgi:hypothetical protein
MKGFQQVNILCNQRLMRSGKQPLTFANRDRRQRRPQDADFGIAPSEEWRLMSPLGRNQSEHSPLGVRLGEAGASAGRRLWNNNFSSKIYSDQKYVAQHLVTTYLLFVT